MSGDWYKEGGNNKKEYYKPGRISYHCNNAINQGLSACVQLVWGRYFIFRIC